MPDTFENWDKARVREAVEGLQREERHQRDVNARVKNAEAWFTLHPEYVNEAANNQLMNHELVRTFGEIEWTIDHYDAAYQSLRRSNFLKLDQREVAKQNKAEAKARAEAERARSVEPTEDELYSLPLKEIRMRDAIKNQKRMQEAGERGGW